jgi:hypothetical protein
MLHMYKCRPSLYGFHYRPEGDLVDQFMSYGIPRLNRSEDQSQVAMQKMLTPQALILVVGAGLVAISMSRPACVTSL